MSGYFASSSNGQSSTGPIIVDPALVEDIKQRVADNLTRIILEQYSSNVGDHISGLLPNQSFEAAASSEALQAGAYGARDLVQRNWTFGTLPQYDYEQHQNFQQALPVNRISGVPATSINYPKPFGAGDIVPSVWDQTTLPGYEQSQEFHAAEGSVRVHDADDADAVPVSEEQEPPHQRQEHSQQQAILDNHFTDPSPEASNEEDLDPTDTTNPTALEQAPTKQQASAKQQCFPWPNLPHLETELQCPRCKYVFPLELFKRKRQLWKSCNECAGKERIQRDNRDLRKRLWHEVVEAPEPAHQRQILAVYPLALSSGAFLSRYDPAPQPEQVNPNNVGESLMPKRRCRRCKRELLLDAFTRNGQSSRVECNVCAELHNRSRRERKARRRASRVSEQVPEIVDTIVEVLPATEVPTSSGSSFNRDARPDKGIVLDVQVDQATQTEGLTLSGSTSHLDGQIEQVATSEVLHLGGQVEQAAQSKVVNFSGAPFDLEYHLNQPTPPEHGPRMTLNPVRHLQNPNLTAIFPPFYHRLLPASLLATGYLQIFWSTRLFRAQLKLCTVT